MNGTCKHPSRHLVSQGSSDIRRVNFGGAGRNSSRRQRHDRATCRFRVTRCRPLQITPFFACGPKRRHWRAAAHGTKQTCRSCWEQSEKHLLPMSFSAFDPGPAYPPDLPVGLFCGPPVQPHREKYFASPFGRNSFMNSAVPSRQRGVAHVINVGRDAVDADCAFDEWRVRRTEKSCGPDAPTLASSSWKTNPLMTVTKKPGRRGEREGNR
jgi:hypothetical protein